MFRLLHRSTSVCGRICMQSTVHGSSHRLTTPVRPSIAGSQFADVLRYQCSRCTQLQHAQWQSLHTSARHCVAKPRNTKKKLMKPVRFKKPLAGAREVVAISPNMTVRQLAETLNRDLDLVFEAMLYVNDADMYDDPNSVIGNFEVIKDIVAKCGFRWKLEQKQKIVAKENKDVVKRPPADVSRLVKRPPVVTIMGHVDHGKTTLLDALRRSKVAEQEFGGITQHIGAFSVNLSSGDQITFLDTPGHAAFSAMRARGARVTDIVVLVVAADDGVMKQTLESIKFAQEAGVPVIVAINKIDRPGVDVEKTKLSLLRHGIQLEDHGGEVQAVHISALKRTNLEGLQEAIMTLAEVMELRAENTGLVEGAVVESRNDAGRGKVSTALVQRGSLKKGAVLVAGTSWAKVRGMFNHEGRPVSKADPGTPVEIIGWKELPSAGEEIIEVNSERQAREVIQWRKDQLTESRVLEDQVVIQKKIDEHRQQYEAARASRLAAGYRISKRSRAVPVVKEVTDTKPELAIVLKGDVDGSVEAILDTLVTYRSEQCNLHIVQSGVGNITEQDIDLASAFNGYIYAFNVKCTDSLRQVAEAKGVSIRHHNVIYQMIDEVREELTERLPLVEEEEVLGEANVQMLFMITEGNRQVPAAGCRCLSGMLQKKHQFKLLRDGEVLIDGPLSSLKHFKNEVPSIKSDTECGLIFADKTVEPQAGDTVVCYQLKHVKQELEWTLDF